MALTEAQRKYHREYRARRRREDPEFAQRDRDTKNRYNAAHPVEREAWRLKTRDRVLAQAREATRVRKEGKQEEQRQYLREHPETNRHWEEWRLYGLTLEAYKEKAVAQGHVCACCGKEDWMCTYGQLLVDHCHTTGKARALVCDACEKTIACSQEDSTRLRACAQYLDTYNG